MSVTALQEQVIKIDPNQEVQSTDFMDMQTGPQQSVDALVTEALGIIDKYTGLGVSKSSATSLLVSPGRIYVSGGPRYRLAGNVTLDLLNMLPTLGLTRLVSIVATGIQTDTETGYRRFVINPTVTPPITEPRAVPTRTRREIAVNIIQGVMATSPLAPNIPPGSIEIAQVTLSETGVVGQPVMNTVNLLKSLSQTQSELDAQQDEIESMADQVASLKSDLIALASKVDKLVEQKQFNTLTMAVARINEKLDIPDTAIMAGIDVFESESESDPAAAGYDCVVDWGGVNFPRAASQNDTVALLNPTEPSLYKVNGEITMPKFTSTVRLQSKAPYPGLLPASDTPSGTWQFYTHYAPRVYLYYGSAQTRKEFVAELSQKKSVKLFDPVANDWEVVDLSKMEWTFRVGDGGKGYVKIQTSEPDPKWPAHQLGHTINGSGFAQTFMNSRAGQITAINFYLATKAGSGGIDLVLTHVKKDGTPDILWGIERVNVPNNALVAGWNRVVFSPRVLQQQTYAVCFVTGGAHVFATTKSDNNPVYVRALKGSLFQDNGAAPGGQWANRPQLDLALKVEFADFDEAQTVVPLTAMSLAGGVSNFDVYFHGHQPPGTDLVLRGQIGGVWRNLDLLDLTALTALPNLIPLQLVYKGTASLMPWVNLEGSRIVGFRPKTQMTHVSTVRTLGSSSTNITVSYNVRDFDDVHHNLVISLLIGSPGYTTVEAADSITVFDTADDRVKRVVAKFTPAALTSYKIKAVGSTDAADNVFTLMSRTDVAA